MSELPDRLYVSRAETPGNFHVEEFTVIDSHASSVDQIVWACIHSLKFTQRRYLIRVSFQELEMRPMIYVQDVFVIDPEIGNSGDAEALSGAQAETMRRAAPIEIWLDRDAADSYILSAQRALNDY